jgi:hypothetical protein
MLTEERSPEAHLDLLQSHEATYIPQQGKTQGEKKVLKRTSVARLGEGYQKRFLDGRLHAAL